MLVLTLIAEVLTSLWLFAMGACFGSFMNVVIYRLPRGMTLFGNSHCPACGQPIWFRDNIPVVSWLILGGRCRHCSQRISSRYWQLELGVALIWMILAVMEIACGARNLPITPRPYRGFAFNFTWQNRDLIVMSFLHITLLMQLLIWAMIDYDGYPAPRWWSLGFLGLVLLVAWSCPAVHPACGWFPAWEMSQGAHFAIEMAVAVCVGVRLSTLRPRTPRDASPAAYAVYSSVAVCWSLGLAALPTVLLAACVLIKSVSPRVLTPAGAVWIGTVLTILFWKPVNAAQIYLGFGDSPAGLILAAAAVLVVVPLLFQGWQPKLSARPND